MLKDEIRKPYFLKLKTFLWEQGVKGPTDSVKGLQVYPERKNTEICNNDSAHSRTRGKQRRTSTLGPT